MADIKVLDTEVPCVSRCAQKEVLRSRCGHGSMVDETHVDALVGETGRYRGTLFFGVIQEDGEVLDCGHGDVPAIVAGQ